MIEAISTLAILAMIMTAMLVVLKPQMQILKAKDAQRKADLNLISKALEDYLNDHPCYPEESMFLSILADCGGTSFRPYLSKIPCDPVTKQPYPYERPECKLYAFPVALSTPSPSPGVQNGYGCYDGECRQIIVGSNCPVEYLVIDCYGQCVHLVNQCQ